MTLHPFNNPKNIIYSHVIKIPTFGLRQTSSHHAQVLKSKTAIVCSWRLAPTAHRKPRIKVENGGCMRSGKRKTHNLVRNYLAKHRNLDPQV